MAEQQNPSMNTTPLTESQQAVYTDMLWERIGQIDEARATTASVLENLYTAVQSGRRRQLNLKAQHELEAQEEEYWYLHAQHLQVVQEEEAITGLLERIEEGAASLEEVLAFVPEAGETEEVEPTLSKKKQAIAREQERFGSTQVLDINIVGGVVAASDPRRISSGRNRKRVVASDLSSYDAQDVFYSVTADTHGGKSRKPGKAPKAYVGKSGKRIRKR